jgi:hypothetical protein
MSASDVEAIQSELSARLARGTGKFAPLFVNWIKYQDNSTRLYKARDGGGRTYLLDRLRAHEVAQSLTVLEIAQQQWGKDQFHAFLNAEDGEGNGVWHYLADNLRVNEGRTTLRMARLLIGLDVDFARRNKHGISPLGKMLLPTPKWQSINALIQTRHLQIGNIEAAVQEHAKGEAAKVASTMSGLFTADLSDNRALLSQHVLKQALQSNVDKTQRAATCRLFFDYVDGGTGTTAFVKLIGQANPGMFEDLVRLLLIHTEETVMGMTPPDAATKKVYRQAVLCRRLLKRDRAGRTPLVHCLERQRLNYLRKLIGFLINDDLAIKKLVRGEPQPQPVVIDKSSPAPANPLLSALLARDGQGDTLLHAALLRGGAEGLGALLVGLASNDIHALLTRVPDGLGLTMQDAIDPARARARLAKTVQAGRVSKDSAQARLRALNNLDREAARFVTEKIAEIESLASDTKGGAPLAPSFDLKRTAHQVMA